MTLCLVPVVSEDSWHPVLIGSRAKHNTAAARPHFYTKYNEYFANKPEGLIGAGG